MRNLCAEVSNDMEGVIMKKVKLIGWGIIVLVWILCIWGAFYCGIQWEKTQIVKEAMSKLPHGKIDLSVKENWEDFIKEW